MHFETTAIAVLQRFRTAETQKLLRMVKLTMILLTAVFLQVSAKGNAQKISYSGKNVSLKTVFASIEKQTGFVFFYNNKDLQNVKPVTVSFDGVSLEEALNLCLKAQPLSYVVKGTTIFIKAKESIASGSDDSISNLPPPIDIHGRIVNEKGEPVMASVQVKGTSKGTTTNDNGEFNLKGVDDNAMLVISGVGIETFEVKVNGRSELALNAKVKTFISEEVIVNTGYQTISKERATGSFLHLDNKILNRLPSTDMLSRLQGVASGVQIISSANDYGSRFTQVQVRGLSTIQGNYQPLIVYDNFPYEGDLKSINPNDIEDITILKDAAAASIWGARSGNGVIVITSKKGRSNQPPRITLTSNVSIGSKRDLHYVPIMSSSDYVDLEAFLYKQGFYQTGISSPLMPALTPAVEILLKASAGTISSIDSARAMDDLKSTDVRDELSRYFYQTSVAQQHSVSISGGGTNHQYFTSVGYDKNIGSLVNNSYDRITVNANNTFSLLKNRLELNSTIWYASSRNTSSLEGPVINYPYLKIVDANGNASRVDRYRSAFIDTVGNGQLLNWQYYPLNELQFNNNKQQNTTTRLGLDLKYKLIKGVEASVKYLHESGQSNNDIYYPVESYFARDLINLYSSINGGKVSRAIPLGGILDYSYSKYNANNIRTQLNFHLNHATWGQLNAIAGAELRSTELSGQINRAYGYDKATGTSSAIDLVNAYPTIIDGNYNTIPNLLYFSGSTDRYVSLFANAAYSFQRRYTLTASARKDGSNQFGVSTNNKWSPLWSAGFSWETSNEKFYRVAWLPYLKLRATFGYQGNVDKSVAAQLTTSLSYNNKWQQNTAAIRNVPNPDLRWERTSMLNIGVDFSTPRNTLSGSMEYYHKNGYDLMGVAMLPPSSGQVSYRANTANLTGSGWDLTVNTQNIRGKIAWQTKLLFSYNTDKITSYKAPVSSIRPFVTGAGPQNPVEGNAVYALYAYEFAGLDPATGAPLGYLKGNPSTDYKSIINSADLSTMKYQGRITAPYFGNIINYIQWSNVEFSFNIVGKFGHVFRRSSVNYTAITQSSLGHNDYSKRWQKPGDEAHTTVPAFIYPTDANSDLFYNYSSILTEKADFLRLQDVRISYNIKTFSRIFKQLEVSVTGSNLGLLWAANNYKLDPEYLPSPNSFYTKPSKLFSAGIKATF